MSDKISVRPADQAALDELLSWLEEEYREDNEGFWCNRSIISDSLDRGELFVAIRNRRTIGFSVGPYAEDIVCVKKTERGTGAGTRLFECGLERAYADGVPILRCECAPHSSLTFWLQKGFIEYQPLDKRSSWGNPYVFLPLDYVWPLPPDGQACSVKVSFYPEDVVWSREPVEPFLVESPTAVRLDDGTIQLAQRVTGNADWTRGGRDLVVRIEVDGVEICFCKAKYEQARLVGVESHYSDYYVDRIRPKRTEATA